MIKYVHRRFWDGTQIDVKSKCGKGDEMLKRHTTYTLEIDDQIYPAPFGDDSGTMSDTATAHISADGLRAVVGCLCQDDSPADPFEEFDEGEFYQFDRYRKHDTTRPDLDEFKRLIRENGGRLVLVDDYGYGFKAGFLPAPWQLGRAFKRHCPRGYQWAINQIEQADGYYIPPADATDPAQYAKGAIDQYSTWCNGDVYGVLIWQYTRATVEDEWQLIDRDGETWGYYGYDYAREELTAALDAAKGELQ